MAHGYPDYGVAAPKVTVYSLQDMAELAARLGSINTFDRRGDVVWMDDFEHGIVKWHTSASGTGNNHEDSTEAARSGSHSLKLTAGSTADRYYLIDHYRPLPVTTRVGFEFSFALPSGAEYVYWACRFYTGAQQVFGYLRYIPNDNKIQYQNQAGTWVDVITSHKLSEATYLFNTVKVVVDYNTQEYIRILANARMASLAGLSLRTLSSAAGPYAVFEIMVQSFAGTNKIIYVDDVIITQNEP